MALKTGQKITAFLSMWMGVAGLSASAQGAELAISCGALGQELTLCEEGAAKWSQKTGHKVTVISTPNSTTERLSLYQQLLAAGSSDIDVFQIDVVWPSILAAHLLDLKADLGAEAEAHFKAIVENNTVDGKLVAMPWFTDAGVLYYRKDLLEKHNQSVPTTWQELTKSAQIIQKAERAAGQDKLWGFVWQGNAYEGLTCDALEWVVSHNGGQIVERDGTISINNPKTEAALTLAASWVGDISPEGVLGYQEEEARGVFQSGNAVFMRNWPYAWSLANSAESPVKGKVGVVALPKGRADGRSAATLGGWQLSVSKYSKSPQEAIDLVKFLTSYQEQKHRAVTGSYNPTIEKLYQDADVLKANPFFGDLYQTFVNATARPSTVSGRKYNQVSKEFWEASYSVLNGSVAPKTALANLERSLKRLKKRGW